MSMNVCLIGRIGRCSVVGLFWSDKMLLSHWALLAIQDVALWLGSLGRLRCYSMVQLYWPAWLLLGGLTRYCFMVGLSWQYKMLHRGRALLVRRDVAPWSDSFCRLGSYFVVGFCWSSWLLLYSLLLLADLVVTSWSGSVGRTGNYFVVESY